MFNSELQGLAAQFGAAASNGSGTSTEPWPAYRVKAVLGWANVHISSSKPRTAKSCTRPCNCRKCKVCPAGCA